MSKAPEINHRARKILHAVVSEYLQSGTAVGSRTVTRRRRIDLSPATVRNVMADLEELGLLEQPHTSAGRIPTRSGLRFFIDALLTVRSLSRQEKEAIRAHLGVEAFDLDEVAVRTSNPPLCRASAVTMLTISLSSINRMTGLLPLMADPTFWFQQLRGIRISPVGSTRAGSVTHMGVGVLHFHFLQPEIDKMKMQHSDPLF